jgi:GT2 family glycosyltransferase
VVVFLDSDMTVVPGFLRAHAELHGQEDHAVGIGDIRFGGGVPSTRLSRYLETRGVHKLAPGEPVPFKCFATGNASVRRDRLLQAGLFDEEFTAYGGEDLELGYRLHLQGARFRFLAKGLAHHHHLRRLDELCSLMYTYGRSSIPILLRKHPELAPVLRLGFLDRPRWSIERLLLRAALFRPAYWPVRAAVGWGCAVPSLALDYLWWHNRTRGYLDAVRASRHSGGRRTVADERTSS